MALPDMLERYIPVEASELGALGRGAVARFCGGLRILDRVPYI
jgi:hypothetical protein